MKFRCSTCDKDHDLAELSFGADAPAQWSMLRDNERARSELSSDQCVIDADDRVHYFVRGCLDIPILGTDRVFTWGVWTSLSEANFFEMSDRWEDPGRVRCGPYFGWLCTAIPEYPDTMYLKAMVHQQSLGVRPRIELDRSDHPLAVDQRDGVEMSRLEGIATRLLHQE